MKNKTKDVKERVLSLLKKRALLAGMTVALTAPVQAHSLHNSDEVKDKTELSQVSKTKIYTETIKLGNDFDGNIGFLHKNYTDGKKAIYDPHLNKEGGIVVYQFKASDEIAFYHSMRNTIDLSERSFENITYASALKDFSDISRSDVKNLNDVAQKIAELKNKKENGKRSERRRAIAILSQPCSEALERGISFQNALKTFNKNNLGEIVLNHEQTHAENREIMNAVTTGQIALTPEQILKCSLADELASCLSEKPQQKDNTSRTIQRFNDELWSKYETNYHSDHFKQLTNMTSYKILYAKSLIKKDKDVKSEYSSEIMDKNFDETLNQIFRKFDVKTKNEAKNFIKTHSLDYKYALSDEQIKMYQDDELPISYHQAMLKKRFETVQIGGSYENLAFYGKIDNAPMTQKNTVNFQDIRQKQR